MTEAQKAAVERLRPDQLDTLANHADWLDEQGGQSREIAGIVRLVIDALREGQGEAALAAERERPCPWCEHTPSELQAVLAAERAHRERLEKALRDISAIQGKTPTGDIAREALRPAAPQESAPTPSLRIDPSIPKDEIHFINRDGTVTKPRTHEEIATSLLAKLGMENDHIRAQLYAQSFIAAFLREAADAARQEEREALRGFITKTVWCGPRCGHGDHQGMREVLAWLDARSRPEEPKP